MNDTPMSDRAADAILDLVQGDRDLREPKPEDLSLPNATYHGIIGARHEECGHWTLDTADLEMWNDLDGSCPSCSERGTVTWWLADGSVGRTRTDDDGVPVELVTLRGPAATLPPR